jgi:3-deoxy-D-manno-octulosonate 8-phosphate phosphatase (KDO 8-P phosphatase)
VGLAAAPADARPEARAVAHLVTTAPGGRGAVRELCDLLIAAKGVAI